MSATEIQPYTFKPETDLEYDVGEDKQIYKNTVVIMTCYI